MTGKEGGHIDHASADATPPHVNAVNPDALEVAPGTAHERLEGWIPELASEDELRAALEKAFGGFAEGVGGAVVSEEFG
jgi:hypothetical protein